MGDHGVSTIAMQRWAQALRPAAYATKVAAQTDEEFTEPKKQQAVNDTLPTVKAYHRQIKLGPW